MQTETDHQPRLERQREPRQHRIKRARIAFDDVVLTGVVLDLSCSGARIYVRGAKVIPPWVQLHLPDATVAVAHLRWRQQDECGFAFGGIGVDMEAKHEPA
jgi:hypothetical protein